MKVFQNSNTFGFTRLNFKRNPLQPARIRSCKVECAISIVIVSIRNSYQMTIWKTHPTLSYEIITGGEGFCLKSSLGGKKCCIGRISNRTLVFEHKKPLEKFEGDFFQFQTDEDSASISSSLGIKKSASTSRLQKFFGLFK